MPSTLRTGFWYIRFVKPRWGRKGLILDSKILVSERKMQSGL